MIIRYNENITSYQERDYGNLIIGIPVNELSDWYLKISIADTTKTESISVKLYGVDGVAKLQIDADISATVSLEINSDTYPWVAYIQVLHRTGDYSPVNIQFTGEVE